ncbi:MAG: ATP-binding protein, partial [Bacteroidota bacterium]
NHALGTLCVIDFEPRKLTIGQIESLKALANQVMHLFESRRNQMLLSKTMKALQEKNIQMEEFNFTACHDLQEPLQTITNFSELLIKKGSLDKESTFYVDLINSSAKRMKELITGLLEYSQIDKGLKIEEVDCNEILEQVKIDLLYSIEQNEATLEIANLPTIRTNKAGIKQVFQNLISNAIKFHKPGVNPKIKIDVIQSDGQFQFCVQDNGIGIKKEFYGNVFSIFNRLHNSNEYQGLGIGLAHSKKILEALGGEIWIESEFGVGSKFYFKLPLII